MESRSSLSHLVTARISVSYQANTDSPFNSADLNKSLNDLAEYQRNPDQTLSHVFIYNSETF